MGIRQIKSILLIDIPTYEVNLPEIHRKIIRRRLSAQIGAWQDRTGMELRRPGLTYSRGMLSLAAVLERKGYFIKYLNYSDPLEQSKILNFCNGCDLVGITSYTPTINIAYKILNQIKATYPAIITVMGGAHVTAKPIDVLQSCADLDFAMIGECEDRLPLLLESMDCPDLVGGTAYRDENGEVMISTSPIHPVNVAELPLPAYHLLTRPLSEYSHNIRFVRGCPYNCSFCYERNTWHQLSTHSINQILQELTLLADNLSVGTLVHFSDAIFNLNWNHTAELVERIGLMKSGLVFSFDTRVDLVEETQIHALVNSGFVNIRMGFESIRNDILEQSHKSITWNMQLAACETIRKVSDNIAIHAYMITGLPGATRNSLAMDIMQIYDLISNNIVDTIGNKILVPYPGTDNFDKAQRLGIQILTNDWSKYDRRSFPVYRLTDLSSEEIYLGYMLQEAILTEAYRVRMNGNMPKAEEIQQGMDYIYRNYA